MAKKKKKRSPNSFQNPHKSARVTAAKEATQDWSPRLPLPQRRLIAALAGLAALCISIFIGLWLPSQGLVDDLRTRGVTVTATVTEVDDKPESVQVHFKGTKGPIITKLSEYAGMRPEVNVGQTLVVVYDSKDPSRVLTRNWVDSPPFVNLPMLGTAALALLLLAASVFLAARRRHVLHTIAAAAAKRPRSSSLDSKDESNSTQLSKE